MKEITDSIKKVVKERLSNTIYGTFFVSWLIFHWEFVYTLLSVDQEIIWNSKLLFKNDYLIQEFFNFSDFYFYISWIAPFILTWLIITVLPKYVFLPLFKKEEDHQFEKKKYRIDKEKKLIEQTTELEKAEVKKLDIITEKVEKQQELNIKKDPKDEWEQELKDFKRTGYGQKFLSFLDEFYSGYRTASRHHAGDVSYFDALELIEIGKDGVISGLTEKGKYFTRKLKINVY